MLTFLVLLLGCNRREPNPCPFGCLDDTAVPGADTDTDADTGDTDTDTGDPPEKVLEDDCTPPSSSAVDPFVLIGSVKNTEGAGGANWFVEILDIAYLPDEGQVLAAGQAGVVVYDVIEPTNPITRDHLGAGERGFERYYNLLPIEPGSVWATHREYGLDVLDVSDPDSLRLVGRSDGLGYEGLDRNGDVLYVTSTRGHIDVYDVSDPQAPDYLRQVSDLERPWDVLVVGDYAYVADGAEGLVVLSVAEPDTPVRLTSVSSDGQPFRLAHDDGTLYMVSGAGGLEIFDLTDPAAPERVSTVDVGGGALDVAADDGLVGVVTQEAVVLLDVGRAGTPGAPLPFSYEETEQFAMTIDARSGYWTVGDWNILGMWTAADEAAPAIDLSVDTLAYLDGAETRKVSVTNRGGAALTLAGIVTPDGVSATVSADVLAPGETGTLSLTWDGEGELDDATVCVASDDPGRPTLELVLTSGTDGQGKAIGQIAPNFTLTDLDGNTHRLSEQRGHPVLLAYFATW